MRVMRATSPLRHPTRGHEPTPRPVGPPMAGDDPRHTRHTHRFDRHRDGPEGPDGGPPWLG